MDALLWLIAVLLSFLVGGVVVACLVAPPLSLSRLTFLLTLSAAGMVIFLARFFPGRGLALAIPLCLVGIIAGYLAANYAFLAQREKRALPPIHPPAAGGGDTAGGGHSAGGRHTAVIYFTHGEPPGYSPLPWLETFHEFDADHAPFIPVPFRAFFFNSLRAKYLQLGGSPHNFVHQAMLSSLEDMFRRDGDATTRFYLAFLDANPRPDEVAIRAINAGADRLVLLPVFLTVSSHTQAGADQVKALHPEQYGVEVCQAQPLWNAPLLKQMFVERADRSLESTPKARVGILLVGHGQPAAWDKIYPTQTEQENTFRQAVIELLVQDGYTRENIALAWMEFKEPNATEIAAEMGKKPIDKLLIFSAAISAPSLHSEYDVPEAVRKARLPASIEVINLGAWGADPLVIRAIREQLAANFF